MSVPVYQVDAFAERAFQGNPAAVCLLDQPKPDDWMQDVAAEMNLSETAFVRPAKLGFELRWFTPTVEVDLCGHATLAAASVLWHTERVQGDESISFHTRSGILFAMQRGGEICLDFPLRVPNECEPPDGLLSALHLPSDVSPLFMGQDVDDLLVVIESSELLESLRPNMEGLKKFGKTRGVIVTSESADSRFDFVSRYFAPAAGIDEDPVTGSAHCCLASYWGSRWKKPQLVGYQASARGGIVKMLVQGDRVLLNGTAVMVMRGELLID